MCRPGASTPPCSRTTTCRTTSRSCISQRKLLVSLVISLCKPVQQIHQVDVLVQVVSISLHVTETVRHLLGLSLHSEDSMRKYQQIARAGLISYLGGRRPWIPSNCLSSMVVAIPLTNLEMLNIFTISFRSVSLYLYYQCMARPTLGSSDGQYRCFLPVELMVEEPSLCSSYF